MAVVRMMQMAVDQIVDMIAVRHRRVPAICAVCVAAFMCAAIVLRSAAVRVAPTRRDAMVIDVIVVHMVHVTIMEIIGVPVVAYCCVTAVWTVGMAVSFMLYASRRCHAKASNADHEPNRVFGQFASGLIPVANGLYSD